MQIYKFIHLFDKNLLSIYFIFTKFLIPTWHSAKWWRLKQSMIRMENSVYIL